MPQKDTQKELSSNTILIKINLMSNKDEHKNMKFTHIHTQTLNVP